MENPCKHDKKNNFKTLPVAINIGAVAGRFGIGGIVLVGGALVTATIVSALVFKTRSQRRSSSENMKKSMSPSPETLSVDVPNKLDLMMKTDKDCCADSLPLEVQNPSSDEITSMKEIQTKSIQSLTLDEKHDYVRAGDSNEDIIVSAVVEDEENTSVHDDSAFESEELDNSCEKIDLDNDEQVVMAAQIEEDACLERDEEQKHLMLIDKENDEHVDPNSLVNDEGVVSVEEDDAIEVLVKDIVSKASGNEDVKDIVSEASENGDEEGEDHQETGSMNEAMEAACVNQVEVEDNLQVQFLEETEKDYHDEIAHEVVMEEEAIDATSLLQIEVAPDAQEMHKVCETFVVECVMNRLKEAVDDQTTAKQDTPPSGLMHKEEKGEETAQNVEEQVTIEDELLIEAAKVDDQPDNPPSELLNKEEETVVQVNIEMVTEHELVNKDEVPHDQSVKDDEVSQEEAVTVKEDTLASELMNKEQKDKETTQNVEEHIEDELFNEDKKDNVVEMPQDQLIEAAKDTEHELIKKDEVSEELSPEAKISNHKTEEDMAENQTILVEKQAFASESWNLKLMIWTVLISVWCLCHWYSELPFPELSFVGSLLFILILLGYRNRATYLVKYQ
ncbi:hypothetical protein L1987_60515 [Smallanthus sonchifolius]|uniref:Uncharacterized protein n=1 Tax=Smallanthus sonchifolius TaxID=185202 RepID=A0ACB9D891_9ASTR|nr:hypothetical protein L1987_60515 [Smallanthus sonchifolius]